MDRYRALRNYLLPYCQLDASLHAGAQVETMLEEKINLKGAKEPYNFFRIECDPATTGVYAFIQACMQCGCACMHACVCVSQLKREVHG